MASSSGNAFHWLRPVGFLQCDSQALTWKITKQSGLECPLQAESHQFDFLQADMNCKVFRCPNHIIILWVYVCFLHALCNRLCLSSASFFVVSPSPERRNLQEWKRMKTFLMCFQRIVRHNSYILDRICPIKTHALTLTLHHITVSTTQPDPYCDPYIYIYVILHH